MGIIWKILAVYLCIINLAGFVICFVDKKKAQRGAWRIPEKTLFTVSGLGGCFGFLAGMSLFRHKTKHLSFKLLIPLFCVLWIAAIVGLIILT